MAVFSKRIMECKTTPVVEYVMCENHYHTGKVTYSINKMDINTGNLIERVVRNVRKATADAVWYDTVIDRP